MAITIYTARFLSEATEIPKSYKILRAIVYAGYLRGIGEKINELVINGKLKSTNMLPVKEEFLVPMPMDTSLKLLETGIDRKLIKKARYVKFGDVEFLASEDANIESVKSLLEKYDLQKTRSVRITELGSVRIHNKLNRKMRSENVYTIHTEVQAGSKFWFAIEYPEKYEDDISDLVKLVEIIGLSGKHNIGLGKLKIKTIKETDEIYEIIVPSSSGVLISDAIIKEPCNGILGQQRYGNIITRDGKAIGPIPWLLEGAVTENCNPEFWSGEIERETIPGHGFMIRRWY